MSKLPKSWIPPEFEHYKKKNPPPANMAYLDSYHIGCLLYYITYFFISNKYYSGSTSSSAAKQKIIDEVGVNYKHLLEVQEQYSH